MTDNPKWDAFISQAAEVQRFVRPAICRRAAVARRAHLLRRFSLRLGDTLSKFIDRGLDQSRYGIVVLSRAFIGRRGQTTRFAG